MIKIFKTFVICILALFIVGCATIVSKTKWPITINSNPSGAKIEITDKNGNSIFTGTTPATLKLKSSAGFFIPQSYTIKLSMDNYNEKTITINSTINGWYLGNLLFGGLLGLLIIDPLTGAMYRIDKDIINENLTPITTSDEKVLKIININDLPEKYREHLVAIE